MQITIFGATGRTGIEVLKKALEKDYKIKVLVRDPERLGELKNKVEYIKGDIMNYNDVSESIKGSQAVISIVGHNKKVASNMQTEGIKNIIKYMEKNNIKRLISLTGAGVPAEGDNPKFIDNLVTTILGIVAGKVLRDGIDHAEEIKNSSLYWTIVRAPRLTNGKFTGEYSSGLVGDENLSIQLSRKNLADFIVKIIDDNSYFRKMPLVAETK